MKKNTKDDALEVEKAIKVAVSKEAGVVETKLTGDELLKTPITGRDIMGQMKTQHDDPVGNKLNAATAAGIEMARQSLQDSMFKQEHHWDWHSGPRMPTGLSSQGFLGDDDTDYGF